ncbi:MAG: hypothetical protein U1D30_21710 [Planctomycetota bacterium]
MSITPTTRKSHATTIAAQTPEPADPTVDRARLSSEVEKAFDYRGDVTLSLSRGRVLEGYVFNRDADCPIPYLELFPKSGGPGVTVLYDELLNIRFTGQDTAAGKSWDAWQKKVKEAESNGTFAELYPETLDED